MSTKIPDTSRADDIISGPDRLTTGRTDIASNHQSEEIIMQNYFQTIDSPLIAADFDYFRLPREKWEFMLTRIKQLGVSAIVVSIPWGFHEFSQGSVDLNGATNPRRDVKGLLTLCSAFNLYCLLNPGPYNHQGVLNEGIPFWLLKNTDSLETALTTNIEGWYRAVSKALLNQQWPDGPLIALRVKSQSAEGQQPPYSKQLTEVKWRIWLRKHYDSIETLNEIYGTDYRTVNDVKFPQSWSGENKAIEKDAKEFLEKVQRDTETHYTQSLIDAGWQIPVYPSSKELHPDLPAIQSASLIQPAELSTLNFNNEILILHHPIQIDSEPVEIAQAPSWANGAPIRSDGSVRNKFWLIRQILWQQVLTKVTVKGDLLKATFAHSSLVTSHREVPLKLGPASDTNPVAYRLRLNGDLLVDGDVGLKRGKLSGVYLSEDEAAQVDLNLILTHSDAPLEDFPHQYLTALLKAQMETLVRCATLAENLGQTLKSEPEDTLTESVHERPPAQTLNTLEEARRGLRDADAALRRAITSISGLEDGFATILDKANLETPQPVASPLAFTPEIFDDPTKKFLIELGSLCTQTAAQLKTSISVIRQILDAPDGFTIAQYQQGYETAVETTQTVRGPLLTAITQLRQAIGAEKLPLLVWRIHDQIQEISETLRWGVLRG